MQDATIVRAEHALPDLLAATGRNAEDRGGHADHHPQPAALPRLLPAHLVYMHDGLLRQCLHQRGVDWLQRGAHPCAAGDDAPQVHLHPDHIGQHVNHFAVTEPVAPVHRRGQCRQPGAKRALGHVVGQAGAHLALAVGTAHGPQAMLGNVRRDGRHLGDLMALGGGRIGQSAGRSAVQCGQDGGAWVTISSTWSGGRMGRRWTGWPGWPPRRMPRGMRGGLGGALGGSDDGGLDELPECW